MHQLIRSACIFGLSLLSACSATEERERPDPRCATGAPADSRLPIIVLGKVSELRDPILVSDSVLFWSHASDGTIRRTSAISGCTVVVAKRERFQASTLFNAPIGADGKPLSERFATFHAAPFLLPLHQSLSPSAELIGWTGDSVAIYDRYRQRTLVVSSGTPSIVRAFADTLRTFEMPSSYPKLSPALELNFRSRPQSNPSDTSRGWPTWASGQYELRDRPTHRTRAHLPFAPQRDTILSHFASALRVPRSTGSWYSVVDARNTRIAVSNSARDSVFVADTSGTVHGMSVQWPPEKLRPETAEQRKSALVKWIMPKVFTGSKAQHDSLLKQVTALIAAEDSEPAMQRLILTDHSVWIIVSTVLAPGDWRVVMAELLDNGEVLRCGTTTAQLWFMGKDRMIVAGANLFGVDSLKLYSRAIPPTCPVHRFNELRAWARSTPQPPLPPLPPS